MLKRALKTISYWIITLICHSLRIFTWLPYTWQMALGRSLGRLVFRLKPKLYFVAKKNIELCFPHLDSDAQQALLRKNFESLGMGFFEGLFAAWGSERRLQKLTGTITGLEAVETALARGIGVIILFPHLIPMYLVGHLLLVKAKVPFSLMYHAPKNKTLNDFFLHHLNKFCPQVFNRKHVRNMVKYLQQGNLVWYAPDLDIGRKNSLFIPFFDVPAATLTAPLRIAEMSQAKVFPIAFYRRDDHKTYDIDILPALSEFPSESPTEDLTRINAIVENIVKKKPEQYLWQYKRFNSRPAGEPKFYRKENT